MGGVPRCGWARFACTYTGGVGPDCLSGERQPRSLSEN